MSPETALVAANTLGWMTEAADQAAVKLALLARSHPVRDVRFAADQALIRLNRHQESIRRIEFLESFAKDAVKLRMREEVNKTLNQTYHEPHHQKQV